jgi:hypothetical protein
MTDKTRFRPVLGTDAQIQNAGKSPGWVYFASDTGKIFFDIDSETRVAMGGSGVSLLYGNAPTIEPDEYSQYTLEFDHLEEDITPKEGDLILNQDGIFYRVQSVDTDEQLIICTLMSVSGSGGGGGAGGPSYAKKIGIKITTPETSTLINGQAIGIKFTATSGVDVDGSVMDDRLTVRWQLEAKSGTSYTLYDQGLLDVESGVESIFELGEKLRPDATSRLTMQAVGVNSGESTSKYIEVVASELKLTQSANFSALNRYAPDNVQLQCNAIGSMNKILKYYFDGDLINTVKLAASAENFQSYLVPTQYTSHGSHTIRIELWQAIVVSGNWKEGIMVDPIEFEIGVFHAADKTPVIWLGEYQNEYYNYDPIKIPFLVYDPTNTGSARITLKKNGTEIASSPRDIDTSKLDKWNYFEITDADLDMVNRYSIGCGEIERTVTFMVSKDPNRNMEPVKPDYLKLSFESRGRSNNESVVNRQIWQTADGQVKAEFKDFNWYNNGWVLDEDNNTCLRISNGAQFSIPLGTMTFASTDSSMQSNSIEVQFKVRNVQDYSNLIHNVTRYTNDDKFYEAFKAQTQYNNYDAFLQYYLPIYDLNGEDENKRVTYDSLTFDKVQKEISLDRVICGYYSGNETNAIGFALGPQDAFFSNGTNTVNVNYVENKMVNISMVYSHTSKLMYIYINGILTGVIKSTANGPFTINNNKMVFNSQYCDIDLYKIRVYNTDLNVNDVVTNYAVDYRDITVYDQNKLAEENLAINEYQFKYKNMIEYNEKHPDAPLMPYIIFDTTPSNNGNKLSYSKKTKVNIGVEFVNTGLDRAFQTGELEELAKKDGLWNDDSTDEEKAEAVRQYYLHHCPSWKADAGVEMAVQGTSSEFYPRRNYKLKTKTEYKTDTNPTGEKQVNIFLNRGPFEADFAKHGCKASTKEKKDDAGNVVTPKYSNPCHTKNWYLDNYTNGTERWTMKVDFMESSGSYNTGFANLVANAYSKHPLQDYVAAGAFSTSDPLKSEVTGLLNWGDYRTSVQGFPVLAFHKKSDGSYLFIGLYRMNLDKGSDECYGFALDEGITANFIEGNPPVTEIAECWEFCNNNRGFCSFRDPWDRMELSFRAPEGVANEFNGTKAPWIMDNVEYRYNVNEDAWDLLLEMSEANIDDINEIIGPYGDQYLFNPAEGDYTGGRELAYKLYENWEKVNKWVWSTNTDKVPSQGTYRLVNVGNVDYVAGSFYIFNEESGEYERADGDYEFNQIYYKYDVQTQSYSNAFAVGPALKYEANKFYREENGAYSLISDSAFDSSQDYYMLEETEDYKNETCPILRLCTSDVFDASKTYYTYDGTQTNPKDCAKEVSLTSQTYAPNTYYEAVEVKYGNKTYTHETKEYRAAKFVNELKDWFDIEYLATYFIMTEVFECYDSRGKNAMWASWGPMQQGGNYRWYPIFYDIDTQLGINNTGIPSFDYNVDATEAGNYSTSDSVLWNNFYKYFKNSYILMKYKHLKGVTDGVTWTQLDHAPLYSIDRIEGWYQTRPDVTGSIAMRGERPLIATNLDEYYKYITITNPLGVDKDGITGHIASNTTGTYTYDANGTYFYALQGDRSLSRQQFLTNRIEYIDSWLNQGNYQRGGANRIRGRVAANNAEKTSDIWVETADSPYYDNSGNKTHLFDAEYWLNLTPIRSSYVTVSDDAEAYPSRKYDGVNPVKFNIDAIEAGVRKSANYPEQLLYVYGLNQMTDLGDMSNLYWQEFEISGDASKLTTLKIGYDGLMETKETKEELIALGYPKDKITEKDGKCYIGWYNNKVNQPSIPAGKNASGMPLLKEVNFSNVTINTGSPALDLSSCEKLQNFRATGSNFIDLTFAEGAAMHTCYLPSTITKLDLTECNLLTNLITEYEAPVADAHGNLVAKRGLYIQGMFEGEGATAINHFSILGGGLGYDSYKLLKKYFDLRIKQTASQSKIALTKVNWSPYIQLVEGDVYDPTATYFMDDGHYGFIPYEYHAGNFPIQVLNGEIYRLDESIKTEDINQITDIDMLYTFINDTNYSGTNEGSSCPNISGIMYVANEVPIDEYEVRDKIIKNFPQLTIFFKNVTKVNSARFILQEDDGRWSYVPNDKPSNTQPSVQKIKDGQWFANPYTLYKPEKDAYDFLGWSTTPDETGLISSYHASAAEQQEAWDALSLQEGVKDYTFYAIFTVHKWTISYFAGADENSMAIWHMEEITHGELLNTPSIIPSIPEDDIDIEQRYRFLGWTQNIKQVIVNNENEAKLVNINSILSTTNTNFYGVFVKESVYASATNPDYFTYSATDFTDPITKQTHRGFRLQPNVSISGKVTLPTTYNNQPIVSIAGFQNSPVTHIFWDGECQVKEVARYTFQNLVSLKYFDLAESISYLGDNSFSNCPALQMLDFKNSKVTYISKSAFNGSFSSSTPEILSLPGCLQHLDDAAFSYNTEVGNGREPVFTVNLGGPNDPTRLSYIGYEPFIQNSSQKVTVVNVYGSISDDVRAQIEAQITPSLGKGGTINYVG